MESEKVKEIKYRLKKEYFKLDKEYSDHLANGGDTDGQEEKIHFLRDILTLINELESEKVKLAKAGKRVIEINKELSNAHKEIENQLKDRIAELEKKNEILQGTKHRLTFVDRVSLVTQAKTEAIKEFISALKKKRVRTLELDDFVYVDDICEIASQLGVEVEE